MAFTQVTVSHTFNNADGTAAVGQITFKLNGAMTNGTTTILPSALHVQLVNGAFSQSLAATDDTGTLPGSLPNSEPRMWQVFLQIQGSEQTSWSFGLSHANAPAVDLYSLLPSEQQVN